MTFGQAVSKLRKERKLKQSELAEKLGVTQSMVAKWEGEQARPRQQTLEHLAKALGVDQEELMKFDTDQTLLEIQGRPALRELLTQLPQLADDQIDALRVVVRDMLMRSQMESLFQKQKVG
jgi:transcriptional regulator with XRE-family HTH domain